MKYLVIVESPAKITKFESILPSNYKIMASCGHIMDLDPNNLSLDVNKDFKPTYKFYPKSSVNNNKIKQAYKSCNKLILAVDLDREGEVIGESILKLLNISKYDRIAFISITKSVIQHAIENPIQLNQNMIFAQRTRRFMDRLFGYKSSPLLKLIPGVGQNKKLGCGRVQSTIVKLIIEQDDRVKKALESSVLLSFEGSGEFLINETVKIDTYLANNKYQKTKLLSCSCVATIASDLVAHGPVYKWKMKKLSKRIISKSSLPPYTTATLQCDATTKFSNMTVKDIMIIAQKLYEMGFITYMRSDSTLLSEEALDGFEQHINKKYGKEYSKRHQYSRQIDNAQEAHEAIRPTSMNNDTSGLDTNQAKLYSLIWKRTVASQMADAQIETHKFAFIPYNMGFERQFRMVGSKSSYLFKGYTTIYKDVEDDIQDSSLHEIDMETIQIKMNKMVIKEVMKNPPSRFTESQLIKTITKCGIGRPGTTAGFISKIQEKDYVRMEDCEGTHIKTIHISYDSEREIKVKSEIIVTKMGCENKRLVPTKLGRLVNTFLEEHFPQMMNIQFTVNLEDKLSEIALGKLDYIKVLHEFYDLLKPQVDKVNELYKMSEKTYNNDCVIGKYNEYDIQYVKIKSGTFILVENNDRKLWIKCFSKPTFEQAYKLIDVKINKPKPIVIKQFGNDFFIMKSETGYYMICNRGKKSKCMSLRGIDIKTLDKDKCNKMSKHLFKSKNLKTKFKTNVDSKNNLNKNAK